MNDVSKVTDAERFGGILAALARTASSQPEQVQIRVRREAIEDAINTDFGRRSRHVTAIMEVFGVVEGIKYLHRNLRKFMHPTRSGFAARADGDEKGPRARRNSPADSRRVGA
jgi:coniferyl-aldehyde dehydrogenase